MIVFAKVVPRRQVATAARCRRATVWAAGVHEAQRRMAPQDLLLAAQGTIHQDQGVLLAHNL